MKNKNIIKIGLHLAALVLVLLPIVSFAQTNPNDPSTWPDASQNDQQNNQNIPSGSSCADIYNGEGGFEGLVDYFGCVLARSVVPVLFALAMVVFLWGVTQFIMNSADEAKRSQGKQFMVWGIIGLFVMFSIWGLVSILRNTVDPNQSGTDLLIPALPGQE